MYHTHTPIHTHTPHKHREREITYLVLFLNQTHIYESAKRAIADVETQSDK